MHLKHIVQLLSSPVQERHTETSPAKGYGEDGASVIPGEPERAA